MGEDNKIYVFDKNENLIAVFDKEDEDTIINPRVQLIQNAESIFTFSISIKNEKWQQIKNPENLYLVNNKIYSTNFEGCFVEDINDNNEDLINVTAYERQKLLSRKYVRAWNSTTGFESIDTFMVVIVANGIESLRNDGNLVNSTHLPGTSGYVLDGLLYGTGWTTGDCDVPGTFDLETDQVDIYENILKVQQIWGGILIFDSANKIVHHRSETLYLPHNGYEVKYQKNMQSLEKVYNNKIITKLCPLGEGGLNIKSVNNDNLWLTNFEYTTTELEGIENNPDITDPAQLKAWGERKLQDLCKPRKELTVQAILLYQVEGYELERVDLNDIVDVINYNGIDGDIEQLRVVKYEYNIWDYSDAILELSDITLESTDIFKKNVQASTSINDGTLNTKRIVDYFNNGKSVSQTLLEVNNTIINNKTELEKSDENISARIQQTEENIDTLNNAVESYQSRIANIEASISGLSVQLSVTGGSNLIRNSVGAFGNDYWEGTIVQNTDTDTQINNESKSAIELQNGSIVQNINNLKNGTYNISFNYKKTISGADTKVKIKDEIYTLTEQNWTIFEQELKINDNSFRIEFISDTNNSCLISDLALMPGKGKQRWSQNADETNADTVKIGKGIEVRSSLVDSYTRIDADGNRTFNASTNLPVTENTSQGTTTETLIVKTEGQITGLLFQKINTQVWVNKLNF